MSSSPHRLIVEIKPRTIVMILAIGAVAFALWDIRQILLVIATSVVVASFIEGVTQWFKSYGVNRVVAVFIVYLL